MVPLTGRLYLQAGTGGRAYLGTSAVFDGQIQAFDVTDSSATARGGVQRDGERLLRGGLHLSPDGHHLLTGNGHVFAAPR
jgi:hypothetical protein